MSEALLVLERGEEIVKVATHAFRVLKKAGHLTRALSALVYLKEAAAKRQLTPETLKVVREYGARDRIGIGRCTAWRKATAREAGVTAPPPGNAALPPKSTEAYA